MQNFHNFNIKTFAKFLAVGGGATMAHYFIAYLLLNFNITSTTNASTIGFSLSAIGNYYANAIYTFNSNRQHINALPRFIFIAAIGCGINGIILSNLYPIIGAFLPSQMIATIFVIMWNYTINAAWTFRE